MRLLVAIINNPDHVVDILDEFYDIGVKGATVIESAGMAHLIADHIPFFARFSDLGEGNSQRNRTIFAVIDSNDLMEQAIGRIEKVIGDLRKPDTGVVFALPVDFCRGLDKEE